MTRRDVLWRVGGVAAFVVVVVLLVVLLGCPSQQQLSKGSSRTRLVDVPPTGIELGWGWDSLRETPVPNLCIEFVEAVEYGQERMVTADEVADKSELLHRLDVSAAASVQGLGPISGSAKVEFAEQSKLNSFHSTFLLEARVDNGVKFVAPAPTTRRGRFEAKQAQSSQYIKRAPFPEGAVRLTETAHELARTDLPAFRFSCGDSFVSAVYEGAQLYAMLTLEDISRENQQSWATSMAVRGFGAEVSASAGNQQQAKEQASKMKVKVLQSGGSGGELSLDKEGIARMLKDLPESALRGPKFHRVALTSYDELPDWPSGPLINELTEVEQVVQYWGAYSTLYEDIDFVLSNRKLFRFEVLPRFYERTLQALQDDLLKKVRELTELAAQCSEQGGRCEFSEEDFSHPYHYRIWLPVPVEGSAAQPPPREWRQEWRRRQYYQLYQNEVTDYYVRQPARKNCLADRGAFGCISNAEINHYQTRVTLYTNSAEWIVDDYPVPVFANQQLKNGQECLGSAEGRLNVSACASSEDQSNAARQRFSLNAARHLISTGQCVELEQAVQPPGVVLRGCGSSGHQAWVYTSAGFLKNGDLCLTRQAGNAVQAQPCRNDHTEFPRPIVAQRWGLTE